MFINKTVFFRPLLTSKQPRWPRPRHGISTGRRRRRFASHNVTHENFKRWRRNVTSHWQFSRTTYRKCLTYVLKLSGFDCTYNPAARVRVQSTLSTLSITLSLTIMVIFAIFVMWKDENKQKEAGIGPIFKKDCFSLNLARVWLHLGFLPVFSSYHNCNNWVYHQIGTWA